MKSIIKKILLREFGEIIEDYNEWLEMVYEWTKNPIYEYNGDETIVYNSDGQYLGYWDKKQDIGFVVSELID
jgi:hypothetical protein